MDNFVGQCSDDLAVHEDGAADSLDRLFADGVPTRVAFAS
jgi:hypothetical protein